MSLWKYRRPGCRFKDGYGGQEQANVVCTPVPPSRSNLAVMVGCDELHESGELASCARRRWTNKRPPHVVCIAIICMLGMAGKCYGQWTSSTMSVMTGSQSVFPPVMAGNGLPETLKVRYKYPNSLHPNLRFWFTPDTFEMSNTADNTLVSRWLNVANLCHPGHQSAAECTSAKIAAGDNMAAEALKQSTAGSRPVYKKGIVNNRGVVRFSRTNVDGSAGKFLQMETSSTSNAAGFTTNPFASNKYTIFLVSRVQQAATDTGQHG
jgi:hypothetical protein